MKLFENSLGIRKVGYIIHDYFYRPLMLIYFKWVWLRKGPWVLYKRSQKPTVLYISLINGGGLKKHLADLVNGMKDTYDVWILYDNNILWHWENRNWTVVRYPEDMHLYEVISYINPDIIHVHQLS